MNKEKPSGRGADDKGDKYAPQSPALVTHQGKVAHVASQEDEGSGGSGCKGSSYVKLANGTALYAHRQPPDGEENGNNVETGTAAGHKPYQHEAEMGQEREAKSERRAFRPYDARRLLVLRHMLPNNLRGEEDADREASHCGEDRYSPGRDHTVDGRAGGARDHHSQKGEVAGHKGGEDLSQSKKTDRVHRARRNRQRVE